MYNIKKARGQAKRLSLRRERLRHVHGGGLHRPPLLVVLQQAVELLQVGHDVVLDVGGGDLQAHAAAVKGAREVTRKHLIDHPGHDGNDLCGRGWFALDAGDGFRTNLRTGTV